MTTLIQRGSKGRKEIKGEAPKAAAPEGASTGSGAAPLAECPTPQPGAAIQAAAIGGQA